MSSIFHDANRGATLSWWLSPSAGRTSASSYRLPVAYPAAILTNYFSVELPGIEPELLPGKMASDLLFDYSSFQFSPVR